ncbi:MAG: FAD-dependent oxidoreductase [Clostridia bacterium]|nr:FAD-dependent oxidoreductase [Clostridia bacterium]
MENIKNENIISFNNDIIRLINEEKHIISSKENYYEEIIFNNFILKNRYTFIGYSDDVFFSENSLKQDYYDFYKKILKSNVGLIISGGFSIKNIYDYQNSKIKITENDINNIINFNKYIHSLGTKIFYTIKSEYGRLDYKNKFYNLVNYSASFNKDINNSKLFCMRVSDGQCRETIEIMSDICDFAINLNYDGVLIEGDLYSLVGEMSSREINRRMFGYFSSMSDYSKKLLDKINEKHDKLNILYSFSFKTFVNDIYGKNYKKILSLKYFNEKIAQKDIYKFLTMLVKNGVDGFIFKPGTYETEFLSSQNEYMTNEFIKNLYLNINEYFKLNNIKNKFGQNITLIYESFYDDYNKVVFKENFLFNVTKNILADFKYLQKVSKNLPFKNCIKCGFCSDKNNENKISSCIINPFVNEKISINYNEKIAIVGAGVSGINCALYLVKLGYKVDLYEKNPIINKNNRLNEIFGYNQPLKSYNDYLEKMITKLINENKLSVFVNKNFDLNILNNLKYTTVINATGTKDIYSNIPGAVLSIVKNINDVLDNKELIDKSDKIVINAKTEKSLALAQYLLLCNKNVSLIISSLDFLIDMNNSRLTYYLFALNKLKCNVYLNANVKRIEREFVEIIINSKFDKRNFVEIVMNLKSGKKYKSEEKAKILDIDLFIDENMQMPNNKLFYDIVSSNYKGKVYMIGNSLKISSTEECIKSALYVARNI